MINTIIGFIITILGLAFLLIGTKITILGLGLMF